MSVMSGTANAWNKPLTIKEDTPELLAERAAAAEEQRKLDAEYARKQLMIKAEKLADAVEALLADTSGTRVSNYATTDQYEVKGKYTEEVVALAFVKWKEKLNAKKYTGVTGGVKALGAHRMGPTNKTTGDRGGKVQSNFIRFRASDKKKKVNVHINHSDIPAGCTTRKRAMKSS